MRIARWGGLLFLVAGAAACQGRCPSVTKTSDPVQIPVAAILSISGRYSAIDVPTRDALELWVERNYSADVHLTVEDAGSDGIRAVERLESIWARNPKPRILILSTSSIAMAVAPHLRGKDVMVIANAGHPNLIGSSNDFTFSTFPDLQDECGLVNDRLSQLGAQRLFILHASDVYHQADAALLKTMYQGEIVGEQQYQEGATDFSQLVTQVLASRADSIVIFGFGLSYPSIQSELARRRFGGHVLVDTDFLFNAIDSYPSSLHPTISFVGPANLELQGDFEAAFQQRFGRPMPYFASFIVDGLALAVEAAKAKREVSEVTQFLTTIRDRPMLSGDVTVRPDHHFSYRLAVYRIADAGGFVRVDR